MSTWGEGTAKQNAMALTNSVRSVSYVSFFFHPCTNPNACKGVN